MVIHEITLAFELIAALVTVLFIGRLLLEKRAADGDSYFFNSTKRSLIDQQRCRRAA